MTYEQKLEQIRKILHLLVEDYFQRGALPLENAYAWAFVAQSLVEEMQGADGASEFIKNLHMHPGCYRNIFPRDEAIDNHLLGIFGLRGVLVDSFGNRDTLFFVQQAREGSVRDIRPDLYLVPPLDH
jgi:hypothetical protein